MVGTARAIAHRVRDTLALAYPRRIAVVGHPDRLDLAEDSLRSLPNGRVYRIAVSDLDASAR